MRKSVRVASWAVYQATVLGQPGPNVVCTQAEWEAVEKGQPGAHLLIREGITNEGEAERLARGASGETKPRVSHKKAVRGLPAAGPDLVLVTDGAEEDEGTAEEGPVILPFPDAPEIVKDLAASDGPPEERVEIA
jgi:hypothetical protein